MQRRSGVLLHPTCLPSPGAIGTFGAQARQFVDFLHDAGQSLWQVLPLGPTGHGHSPYAAQSSFAGNAMLIDLDELRHAGWLTEQDDVAAQSATERVAFDQLAIEKQSQLAIAADRFLRHATKQQRAEFAAYSTRNADWLDDYATWAALKLKLDQQAREQGVENSAWNRYWPPSLAGRQRQALADIRGELADAIDRQRVWQYWFETQWLALRSYAASRGVRIIGDLPIYVAEDSADVWAAPQYFLLDQHFRPRKVAGVPPDYFSKTGQLWGNPVYDWPVHQAEDFAWWTNRFARAFELYDEVRIDHFRGFCACWEIPAAEKTAINGEWVPTPGEQLLTTVRRKLGELPLIAENLGVITEDVEALRERLELPGMVLLQVTFESSEPIAELLPENHVRNSVVYTGTHDNDTTLGWWQNKSPEQQAALQAYFGKAIEDPAWELTALAWSSCADTAIVPVQDLLSLGSEARMNTPATAKGNWSWRLPTDYDQRGIQKRLATLTKTHRRG
ncbi:MAG: 4-alpha-glucanotransferase [Deltaproteobacteria bacterium]|nr:4-alpha-glucanotransferase [Deltaproteobacteria bacterium]